KKSKKTYNSGDSLVVTHLTTSPPVKCLCKAERTGSPGFIFLWSYVLVSLACIIYIVLMQLCASSFSQLAKRDVSTAETLPANVILVSTPLGRVASSCVFKIPG
ncbi:hypothetical protein K458DRAFT_311739, partial [Lentithecium fluviatile CBS 122367]